MITSRNTNVGLSAAAAKASSVTIETASSEPTPRHSDLPVFGVVAGSGLAAGSMALHFDLEVHQFLCFTSLVATLIAAAYTDANRRIIPNRLVILGLTSALSLQLALTLTEIVQRRPAVGADDFSFASFASQGITNSLIGTSVCFAVMCLIRLLAGCGGGDVKLAAVIGSIAGWQHGLLIIVWCHLSAGVVVTCGIVVIQAIALGRRCFAKQSTQCSASAHSGSAIPGGIPMAPFFLLATLLVLSGVIQP